MNTEHATPFSSAYWIEKLGLMRHSEGGYFRRTYQSSHIIAPDSFTGLRPLSTSIYYLLEGSDVSLFHKLKSDELWYYHAGSPLAIYLLDSYGQVNKKILGPDFSLGQEFFYPVHSMMWFGAEVVDKESYTLVSCVVSPGFDFDDFVIAKREKLIEKYPQHSELILRLTKETPPALKTP